MGCPARFSQTKTRTPHSSAGLGLGRNRSPACLRRGRHRAAGRANPAGEGRAGQGDSARFQRTRIHMSENLEEAGPLDARYLKPLPLCEGENPCVCIVGERAEDWLSERVVDSNGAIPVRDMANGSFNTGGARLIRTSSQREDLRVRKRTRGRWSGIRS